MYSYRRYVSLRPRGWSVAHRTRQIQENADKWQYCWLFEVGNMRNSHLKTVRKLWKEYGPLLPPRCPHNSRNTRTQHRTDILWPRRGHGKSARRDARRGAPARAAQARPTDQGPGRALFHRHGPRGGRGLVRGLPAAGLRAHGEPRNARGRAPRRARDATTRDAPGAVPAQRGAAAAQAGAAHAHGPRGADARRAAHGVRGGGRCSPRSRRSC